MVAHVTSDVSLVVPMAIPLSEYEQARRARAHAAPVAAPVAVAAETLAATDGECCAWCGREFPAPSQHGLLRLIVLFAATAVLVLVVHGLVTLVLLGGPG